MRTLVDPAVGAALELDLRRRSMAFKVIVSIP